MTADRSLGPQDPVSPETPIITDADLIRRVALLHAAMDEYEMKATEDSKRRAEERDRKA